MLNPVSYAAACRCRCRLAAATRVAIGLTDGSLLEEFEIPHTAEGFREFLFAAIEGHAKNHPYPIAVAMEGYNGHVRPLDSLVRSPGLAAFQCQQSEAGTLQGDLSGQPPRAIASTPERLWSCSSSATTCRWPAMCSRKSWQRPRRTTSSSACRGAGAAW